MSWETSEQRARAVEAYTERLHPRDRSGRWAELPGGPVKTALVRGGGRGPLTGPLAGPAPKGMAWDPRDHSEVRAGEGRPARAARMEYRGFKVGQRVALKTSTAGRHAGAFGGELQAFEPRDGGARFVAKVRFDNGLVKTFHPAHLVPEGRQSDALTVKSLPLGAIHSGLLNLTAPNEAGALNLLKDARLADKRVRMTPLKRGSELWVKDDYSKASVPVRVKDGAYRVGEAMAKLQRAAQRPRASLPPRVITAHSRRA